jgi:hypothetical protein
MNKEDRKRKANAISKTKKDMNANVAKLRRLKKASRFLMNNFENYRHLVPPEGCELFVLTRRAHEEGDTLVLPSVLCIDDFTLGGTKAVPASTFYEVNHLSLTPHPDPTLISQYVRSRRSTSRTANS